MLLDSHVALAVMRDESRIGPRTRAIIEADQTIFSAASTWELTIKVRTGRLEFTEPLGRMLVESGFRHLPVLVEHTLRIGEVEGLPHADPFDRLLLAQALVERVDFLTWDRQILAAGLPFVRDARA
ncbi:MAG: type II toxin-antitoxin system VapC family toxin [Dermatophilaceae bacterium]